MYQLGWGAVKPNRDEARRLVDVDIHSLPAIALIKHKPNVTYPPY
jgi:hypothetical protein